MSMRSEDASRDRAIELLESLKRYWQLELEADGVDRRNWETDIAIVEAMFANREREVVRRERRRAARIIDGGFHADPKCGCAICESLRPIAAKVAASRTNPLRANSR